MRQEKKTPTSKKKAHQSSGIGSYAISMTYGEYLKEYPHGNRDDSDNPLIHANRLRPVLPVVPYPQKCGTWVVFVLVHYLPSSFF